MRARTAADAWEYASIEVPVCAYVFVHIFPELVRQSAYLISEIVCVVLYRHLPAARKSLTALCRAQCEWQSVHDS